MKFFSELLLIMALITGVLGVLSTPTEMSIAIKLFLMTISLSSGAVALAIFSKLKS